MAASQKRPDPSKGELSTVFVFLAPQLFGFFLFVLFPILFSLFIAFTNWSLKPAIETEFLGLENFVRLIGFESAQPTLEGASYISMLSMAVALMIVLAGVFVLVIAMKNSWDGLPSAGLFSLLAGLGMILASFAAGNVNWALLGIVFLFISFLMLLQEDARFVGKGITGPILMTLGAFAFAGAWSYFNEYWKPIDENFYRYLYNTFYLMIAIPLQIAGSLFLALLLTRPIGGGAPINRVGLGFLFLAVALLGAGGFALFASADFAVFWLVFWTIVSFGPLFGNQAFRTLFYLPSFTAGVAVMLLWKQVFNPDFGLLNEILTSLLQPLGMGAEMPRWLLDPAWAKPALIIMNLWLYVGGANMLLYLAGLTNIPPQLYEAADIDGASKWQRFRNITWPQLAPTTFFIIVMTTIAGLQGGFEQARVMTQGGHAGSTKTLAYYIYEKAFEELALGYASAIAWVLFIIIFGLTLINWKYGNQNVND